jgi:hypothetical protein
MAVVDDTRDFGGRSAWPTLGARQVELGPLACDRRLASNEARKRD